MNINEIKKALNEAGATVVEKEIFKNGEKKKCLIVGDGSVRPTLHESDFEKINDSNVDEFIKQIVNYKEDEKMNELSSNIGNFVWVKDKLVSCVGPWHDDDVIRRKVYDICEYVRINAGFATCAVKKEMIERWNITEDELFDIARSNMQYNVMTLEDMIFGIMNDGIDDGMDLDNGLNGDGPYVITTPGNVYGASCIVNNEFMDKVHSAINEDFFIIPSSVHEVIIFPESLYDESMKDMIRDVNSNIVSAEDVLSDNMFAYIDGELKIA